MYIFISAWALALSVQQYRAMRRSQFVEQATGSSRAFYFVVMPFSNLISVLEGELGAAKIY